jgi:hypothetical protein
LARNDNSRPGQLGLRFRDRLERVRVLAQRLFGDHVEPTPFDARGRAREIPLDHALIEPDGFEHLRPAIALQGGNAHLRKCLQQTFIDGLDEIGNRFGLRFLVRAGLGGHGFERQIRIHRAGPIADQQREVHHLARLARFDHQRHLRAALLAHQVIVHRGQSQQAGNRGVVGVQAAVRENQQRVARLDGQRRAPAELIERPLQTFRAFIGGEQQGQRGGQKIALRHAAQLFEIAIGEDGMLQLERVAMHRRLVEQVALVADVAGERHHHLFANGVDGRIGHLREELFEIVKQRLRLVGEARQRDIGAHGADRLLALRPHRSQNHLEIFGGIAEGALALHQRLFIGAMLARRIAELLELDLVFLEPQLIRIASVERPLDLAVGDDAAFDRVDQQHFAGLQPALAHHLLGRNRKHARFRRHDHQIVLRHEIARRPQAVAVERGADGAAVGEGDGRRTVPGLHQRRVVFVERPLLRIHVLVLRPGFRNQHRHGVGRERPDITSSSSALSNEAESLPPG